MRWSGEGCWIPLGDLDLGLPFENHTSYPAPGDFILYPGGISETEILLAYGGVALREQSRPACRKSFLDGVEGHEICVRSANTCCGMAPRILCSRRCNHDIVDGASQYPLSHGMIFASGVALADFRGCNNVYHRWRCAGSSR